MNNRREVTPKRRMLTEEELASLCHVKRSTVQRWSRNKIIPGAKKLGRRWLFNPDKAEHWLGYAPGAMPMPGDADDESGTASA